MQPLTVRSVVRFWFPLALTWLMMAVEGPILTSIIARLSDATENLAAFGVTTAIAMLIESPVIMLLSTTVALAVDRAALDRLLRYTHLMNALVTLGMILTSIPFVYDLVTIQILNLPGDVRAHMYWAFVAMIPWPGAIGYRRYYQGVLIRAGRTRRVAIGTGVRLVAMALTAVTLMQFDGIDGALIGTCSLSVAVIFEMLATQWMARSAVHTIRTQTDAMKELTTRAIFRFHAPLALTTAIGFLITPLLAFFIGRAPDPLLSLAVLPVVDSFIFVFRSFGFSYQEAALALMGQKFEHYDVLRRTGRMISMISTGAVLVVAFTPIAPIFFTHVYGLSPELAARAVVPTMILAPLPAIAVLFSLQRGVLMTARQNTAVVWSTFIEVGGIVVVMVLMTALTGLSGAISAALAMTLGRVAATSWMGVKARAVRIG